MDSSQLSNAVTLDLLLTAVVLTVVLLLSRLPIVQRAISGSQLLPDEGPGKEAPGPRPWPVLGSLPLMGQFPSPWEAFVHLRSVYGDVFQIQLGNKLCLVVSSMDAIKEVLTEKAHLFNNRPNFLRYHTLFGGDRDRSLALCDWSEVQKVRRRLAVPHVFPRPSTGKFDRLEASIERELEAYVEQLRATSSCDARGRAPFDKLRCSAVVFNMFFGYFCSARCAYEDVRFQVMIRRFDIIFQDMNNGFALDFLPWLLPCYALHLSKMYWYGQRIRKFLLDTVVRGRAEGLEFKGPKRPSDFLDAVLAHVGVKQLTNSQALYELEDILGGHSAVASFWARLLEQVARRPDVQRRVRQEAAAVGPVVRLSDRPAMPYTQAVVLEALRVTTSPIVPHVAAHEGSVSGFHVPKDAMIFVNNYHVNTSDAFWNRPQDFEPSRFLDDAGRLVKPDYFLPFSTGVRSCLGYQLVQSISFLATVKILQHFDIEQSPDSPFDPNVNVNGTCGPLEKAKLAILDDDVKAFFIPRLDHQETTAQ